MISGRALFGLAIACGLFNILPLFFYQPGADVIVHYALMQCFAEQIWQGDLYPRWCMSANDGLGTTSLLFYFPLPYYLSALLYPLHWLGLSIQKLYVLQVWPVSALAFCSSFIWLRAVSGKHVALLCAFLALWLPYRMEVLFFRNAYAELCFLAVFPLWLHYGRLLAQGQREVWPKLALCLITGFLCNVPGSVIGLMGLGLYILMLAPQNLQYFFYATGAMAAAVAFYAIPAKYLSQYLNPEAAINMRNTWANAYIDFEDALTGGRISIYITNGIMFAITMALIGWVIRKRRHIPDGFIQKETLAWSGIAAVAFLSMWPVSGILWDRVPLIETVIMPWRMQRLIMFALTYLLAVAGRFLLSDAKKKTWKGDYGAFTALLVLLALILTGSPPEKERALFDKTVEARLIHFKAYRTRWNHYDQDDWQTLLEAPNKPRIMPESGTEIHMWGTHKIAFDATLPKPQTLRLRQFYFPTWQGTLDGQPLALEPDTKEGWISSKLPAGTHHVELQQDINYALPKPLRWLWLLSLTTFVAVLRLAFKQPQTKRV